MQPRQLGIGDLYLAASWLLTEDDSNPEYDRALSELIAEFDGIEGMPLDTRAAEVLVILRGMSSD